MDSTQNNWERPNAGRSYVISPGVVLQFGQFKGKSLREIPDSYLFWLCERGRSTYYRSRHSLDVTWRVPFDVWEAARAEADRRGFTKRGERWGLK
jgi:hypothetical protein